METVVEIKISDIRFFGQSRKDHYFKSQEAKITELAESIRRVGILEPLIVRKDKSGKAKYELIAGETRLKAAQKNGMETVPCIIRELEDFDVRRQYSDTNIYRENLSIMEKAYMIRSQRENWEDIKAEEMDVTEKQKLKYIRLTELISMMQELIDSRQISVDSGSLASELPKEIQKLICINIAGTKRILMPQAVKELSSLCRKRKITPDDVEEVILKTQPDVKKCVTYRVPRSTLRRLPEEYRKKSKFEELVMQVCEMLADGRLTLPKRKK